MENKQQILDLLLKTLQATRDMYDLVSLKIEDHKDEYMTYAIATFKNGGKRRINVTGDSGVAMIRDVMKYIDG